jgi:integrase
MRKGRCPAGWLDERSAKVSRFLKSLDEAGFTPRNVNKYRQVLQALFGYACRSDSLGLAVNPVDGTDKRREPPPAPLDFYEIEEVEALTRVCERGDHRPTPGVQPGERQPEPWRITRAPRSSVCGSTPGCVSASCSRSAGRT